MKNLNKKALTSIPRKTQTLPMTKDLAQRVRCSFSRSYFSMLQKVIDTLQALATFSKALEINVSLTSLVKRYEKLGSNESNFGSEYEKIRTFLDGQNFLMVLRITKLYVNFRILSPSSRNF